MKIVKPVVITDAMVTSCTIAEPAPSEIAWVSGTTYTVGQQRIRTATHRVYQCAVNVTGTTPPESDVTNWVDAGPTMKWAMFDNAVNTQSSDTTSITVVLTPGNINSLVCMEMVGTTLTVVMKDAPGGNVVYTTTKNLDGTLLTDWYQYFFEPSVQLTTAVLTDLPPYYGCELTVTISGSGTVKIGVLTVGSVYILGGTYYGATLGIIDYSTKTTDTYGTTKITKRANSKRFDAQAWISSAAFNKVYTLLSSTLSTPIVLLGTDYDKFSAMTILGYYKDFTIAIQQDDLCLVALQFEGLI